MEETIYEDRTVAITPTLVTIAGTTYAVPTISSVSVVLEPSKGTFWRFLGWLIGGPLTVLGLWAQLSPTGPDGMIIIWGPGALILLPAVLSTIGRRDRHVLRLATSSGERQALVSEDPQLLHDLRQHIEAAMAAAREVKPATPSPADTKECPRCAETIKAAAKVCRFCGYEFEPVSSLPSA